MLLTCKCLFSLVWWHYLSWLRGCLFMDIFLIDVYPSLVLIPLCWRTCNCMLLWLRWAPQFKDVSLFPLQASPSFRGRLESIWSASRKMAATFPTARSPSWWCSLKSEMPVRWRRTARACWRDRLVRCQTLLSTPGKQVRNSLLLIETKNWQLSDCHRCHLLWRYQF